eukprot:183631-Rhodomonas_salina.3
MVLSAYTGAMLCPVLTYRMALPELSWYTKYWASTRVHRSATLSAYARAKRCPVPAYCMTLSPTIMLGEVRY